MRASLLGALTLSFICVAGAAPLRADDIDDLLQETDRALGRGDPKAGDDRQTEGEQPTARQKPARKKSQPGPSAASSSGNTPAAPKATTEATSKSVLTPTDAESVSELINVGLRREAQLRPDRRDQHLELAFGVARLHGSHELEKDDDTFRVQSGERLAGASLAYAVDLGAKPWSLGRLGGVRPIGRLSAGYLKGRVAVDRSGVQNARIDPDYNLIPVGAAFGLRNESARFWRLSAAYGPAVEMLVQTGEGESDSTSGLFFTDALDVGIEHMLFDQLWLGATWQARGLVPFAGDKAGHHMLALTVNMPLAG
jgi:hypothetical protein